MVEMDKVENTWSSVDVIGPGIFLYHDVLTPDLQIIEILETYLASNSNDNQWLQAMVGFQQIMPDYRDCFDFKWKPSNWGNKKLDEQEQKLVNMYNAAHFRQSQAVKHYCSTFNIPELQYWESTNFVKYGIGQHFAQHVDHGYSYNCTVSLVGWANDNYEGGELEFGMWNLTIKPQIGDLVIFPSNYMYPHRSVPVLSGTKYSLVTMLDYSEKYHTNEFIQDFYGKPKDKYGITQKDKMQLNKYGI